MDLVNASKLISLAIFFPFFVGVCVWALFRLKPEAVERMRRVPFLED